VVPKETILGQWQVLPGLQRCEVAEKLLITFLAVFPMDTLRKIEGNENLYEEVA